MTELHRLFGWIKTLIREGSPQIKHFWSGSGFGLESPGNRSNHLVWPYSHCPTGFSSVCFRLPPFANANTCRFEFNADIIREQCGFHSFPITPLTRTTLMLPLVPTETRVGLYRNCISVFETLRFVPSTSKCGLLYQKCPLYGTFWEKKNQWIHSIVLL